MGPVPGAGVKAGKILSSHRGQEWMGKKNRKLVKHLSGCVSVCVCACSCTHVREHALMSAHVRVQWQLGNCHDCVMSGRVG